MLLYVVTYDVVCDKRRRKVAALLEGYGVRVQYSVFECMLPVGKFEELKRRLRGRVRVEEDSVRFYPMSGHVRGQVEIWGGVPLVEVPGSVIV
ncbi:CRISPR-associated endonuclease Cas2 [Alkalinema pantanalense CENA528]|uniref:CRISPR-associated endonuclease Cas2 n=1 Tax=Alkalinema pantanalense TaxID=1620705 RepID=UPI003D6E84B3